MSKIMSVVRSGALVVGGVLLSAGAAMAAIPADSVTALQSEITGDIGTASVAGYAIMTVSLGATIGMGLMSRFMNKGARG